jgi:glycosyltransferase involved in cell wall biosynthesis
MTNLSLADYNHVIGEPCSDALSIVSREMPPLRILHVTPYFSDAWAYGGIPRVAGTLARGLARRGHRVTVCTTDARDESSRLAAREIRTPDGVVVHVFPNISNRLAYRLQLFLPLGFSKFLERHAASFDVAHVHACRNMPGAIATHHLRRAGVPYVLAPNGTAPIIERRRLAKRLFDLTFGRGVVSGAARIIAVSEAERRQLRDLGIAEQKIRAIPNPIDLDEFRRPIQRGAFRARMSLPGERVVLFLGKLTPRKRVDVLIRAFADIKDVDARLVIAGNDMGSGPSLRALVRALGLERRTTFTGLLRGAERLEALADADVLVYPSEHEIFGLVPMEALLAGTPVIVSDDSGCGEVVAATGGGQVIPAGDARALAHAIDEALARPRDAEAMADAAARACALYGDEAVCAQIEDLYAGIVEPA